MYEVLCKSSKEDEGWEEKGGGKEEARKQDTLLERGS